MHDETCPSPGSQACAVESLIKSQPAERTKLKNIKHSIQFAFAILELLLLYNSAVFLPGVYTCLQYVFGNMVT